MEKFKAVEKEMKTKAYSKEGLLASAKLDPKEQEKVDTVSFLEGQIEELERQVEAMEAEVEALQANVKKGKKDTGKSEKVAELDHVIERHKWHQKKMEQMMRALNNGGIETEQVKELEEGIKYYVDENQSPEFMEDDALYDDLNLQDEEELFGAPGDVDRVSSQDAQSVQEEAPEEARPPAAAKSKPTSGVDVPSTAARRPSMQLKSPLPALATLHTPASTAANSTAPKEPKPAPPPVRTPAEPLKYASAAAAAAASDKNGIGISPLPPPPGSTTAPPPGLAPLPGASKASATTSPSATQAQPAVTLLRSGISTTPSNDGMSTRSPALSHASAAAPPSTEASSIPPTPAAEKAQRAPAPVPETATQEPVQRAPSAPKTQQPSTQNGEVEPVQPTEVPLTNGDAHRDEDEEESVYHLPSGLQDLIDSLEGMKNDLDSTSHQVDDRMLAVGAAACPDTTDAERPRHYRPTNPFPFTPEHYPQTPLAIFDDPRLYSRIDTDGLFYAFYYRQGTYQQYLAAKALKSQSWRFHKQYQTWFQRHEEPKAITEDYEQGTYRFFDYESTWSVALRRIPLVRELADVVGRVDFRLCVRGQ